jgi:hypothetical protein
MTQNKPEPVQLDARDLMALSAMQALMSGGDCVGYQDTDFADMRRLAKRSYDLAAAMLAEKEARQ